MRSNFERDFGVKKSSVLGIGCLAAILYLVFYFALIAGAALIIKSIFF